MVKQEEKEQSFVRKPTPEESGLFWGAMDRAKSKAEKNADSAKIEVKTGDASEAPDLITRGMLIGEILALYPDSAFALMQCGMGCITCGAAQMESLEEASMVHGLDPDEVVDYLNYKLGLIPLDAN